LDDDEIGFLDEVSEARRAEEERVRRETEDGLAAFRAARAAESLAEAPPDAGDAAGAEWTGVGAARRRKREARVAIKGVKRKASDGADGVPVQAHPAKARKSAADEHGGQDSSPTEAKAAAPSQESAPEQDATAKQVARRDSALPEKQAGTSTAQGKVRKTALVAYGSDDSDSS
jgi:hypothetical protein